MQSIHIAAMADATYQNKKFWIIPELDNLELFWARESRLSYAPHSRHYARLLSQNVNIVQDGIAQFFIRFKCKHPLATPQAFGSIPIQRY